MRIVIIIAYNLFAEESFFMYVCVCRAVTDGQIRDAISNGICTRKQLTQCFGVGKDCGRCNREVKELLADGKHGAVKNPFPANASTLYPEPAK
ncbi:MAG: (2Fe-2S)-binding protein [Pseudomonadota bacterium]